MSKRIRRHPCLGKVRHRTQRQAERLWRHFYDRKPDKSLRVYRCPECRGYHLGHIRVRIG